MQMQGTEFLLRKNATRSPSKISYFDEWMMLTQSVLISWLFVMVPKLEAQVWYDGRSQHNTKPIFQISNLSQQQLDLQIP